MRSPRATRALGLVVTRANIRPDGLDVRCIDRPVPCVQSRISRAALIDREAELQLMLVRYATAERLSRCAAALRVAVTGAPLTIGTWDDLRSPVACARPVRGAPTER